MPEYWIALNDIPADGRDFSFEDQTPWEQAWKAFGVPVEVLRPMRAEVFIQPQGDGAILRGSLEGAVRIPCDRCTTPYEVSFDVRFDSYEDLPTSVDESDGEIRVREENGNLELNIWAALWEQFVLALPVKPLCSEECRGLCPGCGKNLNSEKCECDSPEGDPRLALFRNLKIS